MTDNSILMALAEADRVRYQQQQDETFRRWAAEKSRQMDRPSLGSIPKAPKEQLEEDMLYGQGGSVPSYRYYDKHCPLDIIGRPLAMEPRAYRPGMVVDPQGMPDLEARLKGE